MKVKLGLLVIGQHEYKCSNNRVGDIILTLEIDVSLDWLGPWRVSFIWQLKKCWDLDTSLTLLHTELTPFCNRFSGLFRTRTALTIPALSTVLVHCPLHVLAAVPSSPEESTRSSKPVQDHPDLTFGSCQTEFFQWSFFQQQMLSANSVKKCWVKYPRGSAVKLKRYTDCSLFSYYRFFAATSIEWIVVLSGECCWKSASHATRQRPSLLHPAHRRLSLFEWPKSWAERGRGRYYHQQPFLLTQCMI